MTRTIEGWRNWASVRASRLKPARQWSNMCCSGALRGRTSIDVSRMPNADGKYSLIATCRPSERSSATYVIPKPPDPITSLMRK